MRWIPALLCAALAGPAAAQSTAPKTKSAAKAAAKPVAKSQIGPDLPSKLGANAPVCVVDGVSIPLSKYLDRLSLRFGPEIRETLIQEALLRAEAQRRHVTVTPADIDAMARKTYADAVRQFGSEKALAQSLDQSRGWSLADFKAVLREQSETPALRGKLAAVLVKPDAVTDEEISRQYEEQKAQFSQPETVRVSHILIRRQGDGAEADAAARKRAEELLKHLEEANGANFDQVAKTESGDAATAEHGGAIPVALPRGANPFGAAFDAAVYAASPGLVREVIAAPDGYHLVRVDEKKPARLLPLGEVKEQLRASLLTGKRDQELDKLISKLRASAQISTGKF